MSQQDIQIPTEVSEGEYACLELLAERRGDGVTAEDIAGEAFAEYLDQYRGDETTLETDG